MFPSEKKGEAYKKKRRERSIEMKEREEKKSDGEKRQRSRKGRRGMFSGDNNWTVLWIKQVRPVSLKKKRKEGE